MWRTVSGLFAETFHTPLQIELYMYGDAIFVYSFGTQIYGHQKSTKTSGVHFFYISSIFLFTWELALAYVHINTSSNTLNGSTAENWGQIEASFNEIALLFCVTHGENSEVQIAVVSKWNMLRDWKLVQGFIFYLQPCVNEKLEKARYFNLITIWWHHCENHLFLMEKNYRGMTSVNTTSSRVLRNQPYLISSHFSTCSTASHINIHCEFSST